MFRKELETSMEIDAPAGRVWEVLTDLASYPEWNPMIRRATGELRVGSRLEVRFEPEGRKGHTFRPMLTAVDPGRELRWSGRPRFPGVFDMEHYWMIEEKPGGKSRLRHGASVSGLAAPLAGKAMLRSARKPFEAMNRAHKLRAEGKG